MFDKKNDVYVSSNLLDWFLESNSELFEAHQDHAALQELKTIAKNGLNSNPADALEHLFCKLATFKDFPFFLAIDQWNCLQSEGGIDQPLLKRLFGHYSLFQFRWGYKLLAVSSSFDIEKSGMFNDMDAVVSQFHLTLYTREEWETVVFYFRDRGKLPPEEQLTNEDLIKLTGYVPRLLVSVKYEYATLLIGGDGTWDRTNYLAVHNRNLGYFEDRVNRMLERHSDTENVKFVALVVNNRYKKEMNPRPWIDSGLFYLENGIPIPIAPAVLTAVI